MSEQVEYLKGMMKAYGKETVRLGKVIDELKEENERLKALLKQALGVTDKDKDLYDWYNNC